VSTPIAFSIARTEPEGQYAHRSYVTGVIRINPRDKDLHRLHHILFASPAIPFAPWINKKPHPGRVRLMQSLDQDVRQGLMVRAAAVMVRNTGAGRPRRSALRFFLLKPSNS